MGVTLAYSHDLAERVRDELTAEKELTEREMFGGIAFLVAGHMCCGILGDELIVRVGPELHHDALTRPDAREFDYTGRPMKGWVMVGRAGVADDADLEMWVRLGLSHARSLPPKAGKPKAAAKKPARRVRKAPVKKRA